MPGGRTIYAASSPYIAYLEVLAYLAPAVGLENTTLSDVFTEDGEQPDPRALIEAIRADWDRLFHIDPHKIVQGWRDGRLHYQLLLPEPGWVVDAENGDTLKALNRGLSQHLASQGVQRLTRSGLSGEDRALTVAAAAWIHAQVLDDGSLPHGIQFPSKHAEEGTCWALWLRQIDDGADPSDELITARPGQEILHPCRNPELKRAADALGLIML